MLFNEPWDIKKTGEYVSLVNNTGEVIVKKKIAKGVEELFVRIKEAVNKTIQLPSQKQCSDNEEINQIVNEITALIMEPVNAVLRTV